MADHEPPPTAENESETAYIYRIDPESQLPVVVGKLFKDEAGRPWVRLSREDLAAGIGEDHIQGTHLMSSQEFRLTEF